MDSLLLVLLFIVFSEIAPESRGMIIIKISIMCPKFEGVGGSLKILTFVQFDISTKQKNKGKSSSFSES